MASGDTLARMTNTDDITITMNGVPVDAAEVSFTDGKPMTDGGRWVVHHPTRGRYVATMAPCDPPRTHPPCRRPGARTLGGWRGTLLAPERALDALLGGDAPPESLTPETRIACGLLGARLLGSLPAAA